jgi:hypothetical protein
MKPARLKRTLPLNHCNGFATVFPKFRDVQGNSQTRN